MRPPSRRRAPLDGDTSPLPGISLRNAILLVMGVWILVTLFLVQHKSFSDVKDFSFHEHLRKAAPSVHLTHVAGLASNAAQAAALVPVEGQQYALLLVANYYGKSALFAFTPPSSVRQLAVLQTDCAHAWATWQLGGRRWAAVANYCPKGDKGGKGVVAYELERLSTASQRLPDWGFKAAVALTAHGASGLHHMVAPSGEHLLAVAEYTPGELTVYSLADSEDRGLEAKELQRLGLPGVSAVTGCNWSSSGDSGGGGGSSGRGGNGGRSSGGSSTIGATGEEMFLVGLSYFDGGWSTRSVVYRWEAHRRQFVQLQVLTTLGAHGGTCFSAGGHLFLAVANAQAEEQWSVNSTIWRYDPQVGRFLLHRNVLTRGAHDVQHVHVDGADLLVFANRGEAQRCRVEEESPVLVWEAGRQQWEQAGTVHGECLTGLAVGAVAGKAYMVATGDRNASGSYEGQLTHVWRVERPKSKWH